ncbi:choline sulfatase [Thozetella sp. PMI_491]|nr:choline sulfatase [Thozetella sp. PMI_491]
MAPDLNSLPSSPAQRAREGPPVPGSAGKTKRPNILFIMADQLAAPQLSIYNPESQIKTPNLDSLAAKSVQFDSAYCPSPLCAPSRMSLITGQLPMKIGAFDNAAQISSEVPTYAHYLRLQGYQTVLAGKMHFVGDQLHGYETRLTSDIYPGDFGWVVNWDKPDTRLEWYHNASSILQAGVCVRSNQLDYDEEVMYKSTQFMYDHVREGPDARPFCLTVSLTHPHDPYTIQKKYWDLYDGVDINLPKVSIPKEEQDPHSKRLLKVCDLWDQDFSEEQIKRARRAYYGAVSYVDDCIGKLLDVLKECRLDDNTIIVFSGDHGDMLGERGLWYKMSYFESSVRVPLLVSYPQEFEPHRVKENVSTLDILPTLCDLVGTKPLAHLPMDGISFFPHLQGKPGHDTVIAEYTGEGTIAPLMMIRRGPWKYITCPSDGQQLFNLVDDPLEVNDLAKSLKKKKTLSESDETAQAVLEAFDAEAKDRWDFAAITARVLESQRNRQLVWAALKTGHFTSWDFNPSDDGREKYIRSHMHLDDLERRARFPAVDTYGRETAISNANMASLNLAPEELRAIEASRNRLFQLTNSLGSLRNNVISSNPLPTQDSLRSSAFILQKNLDSIQQIMNENAMLFQRLVVHPSTNFPGRTQEHILLALLRKKLEPEIADCELWEDAREACQERIAHYIRNESSQPYTAAERALGIENVRTGLKRNLDEESEDEEEDEEDDDVMMIDPPNGSGAPPTGQPGTSAAMGNNNGLEPEHILWFAARGDLNLPPHIELQSQKGAKDAKKRQLGGAPPVGGP